MKHLLFIYHVYASGCTIIKLYIQINIYENIVICQLSATKFVFNNILLVMFSLDQYKNCIL